MKKSEKSFLQSKYSHIYVEQGALAFPLTERIADSFKGAVVVPIENYKRVFNRSRQHFQFQKQSPKVILAVKKPPFIYRASDRCQSFGNDNFVYTTSALNCVFNCGYCYLQGMFNSANLVLFVNHEDFESAALRAIDERVDKSKPLFLSVSYDTDLLALENRAGYCSKWIEFARNTPDVVIEIRSKSASFDAIATLEPSDRVVLSWSLAPDNVSKRYERGAPSPQHRLKAAARALEHGWKVRLCFDPVIPVTNWRRDYKQFMKQVFETIPGSKICDVAVGPFRMESEHLKKAKKMRFECDIYHRKFDDTANDIREFMTEQLSMYVSTKKIECFQ